MSEDKAYKLACKLFNDYNYNGTQWEVESQIDSYYNFLKSKENETGKEYDYDKMYSLIEKEYKYKIVPSKNLLSDWQKRCIVYHYDNSKDGELVIIKCYKVVEEGHYKLKEVREYIVSNTESTTAEENKVIHKLKNIYDEVACKHYIKGSCLIGNEVWIPKEFNELGEVTEYTREKVA